MLTCALPYKAVPNIVWCLLLKSLGVSLSCYDAGGIIAWLALGPHMAFGDEWQLNVNTATAVELMIMTTFLQNTKRRHRLYMQRCLAMLVTIDQELEQRLLTVVDDDEVGYVNWVLKSHPNCLVFPL